MFSLKNLLVVLPEKSIDLSTASYLNFLAQRIAINSVINFHVFTAMHLFKHLNEQSNRYGDMLLERIKDDMEKHLKDSYSHIPEKTTEVVAGKLVFEILRKQRSSPPDAIVIGKHTESDATLAKQITRHIPGNTLVITENAPQTIDNIMIPVDLSEHSGKLLKAGMELKNQLGGQVNITCYHSFVMPDISSYSLLRTEHQFHEMVKKNNYGALHKFINEVAGEKKTEITAIVQEEVFNRPDRAILKYVEKNNIDFLIMGTKAHSGIDAFLGSTVERVITNNDKIPMLIIK